MILNIVFFCFYWIGNSVGNVWGFGLLGFDKFGIGFFFLDLVVGNCVECFINFVDLFVRYDFFFCFCVCVYDFSGCVMILGRSYLILCSFG